MTEFHSAVVHHGLSDRSILSGRAAAQLQLGDDALERPTHALRRRRIDRIGIDEEVEPGIVLVDDLRSFARRGDAALDRVGHDRVGDALQRDRLQRARAHHVAHEHEGLVAQHDPARLRNRLQTRGEIGLGADDRVVHPVVAAEIADVAETGVDALRTRKGSSIPRVRHCTLSSARRRCMSNAIARHAFASLTTPRDSGSPKNTRIASPMNLLTVPPCAAAIDDISIRYSLSSAVSSSGCIRSALAVKSTTSEKNTVSFLRSVAISTSLPAKMPR